MPFMEPYFVRSVAAALPVLEGELALRTRAYLAQESEHQYQHRLFNQILVGRYRRLAAVEGWADRYYRWLGRRAGAGFNLAVASASETIAYSAARWMAQRQQDLLDRANPEVAELFWWHLAEEVEHKSVAYEVCRACSVGFWPRLAAVFLSLTTVMWFVAAGTTVMLWGERRLANPQSWLRLNNWAVTFAFELLPNLALSLWPGFHPDQLVDPTWYDLWHLEHPDGSGAPDNSWNGAGSRRPRATTP
jgi:predicted metal-dependent hydrolase